MKLIEDYIQDIHLLDGVNIDILKCALQMQHNDKLNEIQEKLDELSQITKKLDEVSYALFNAAREV